MKTWMVCPRCQDGDLKIQHDAHLILALTCSNPTCDISREDTGFSEHPPHLSPTEASAIQAEMFAAHGLRA